MKLNQLLENIIYKGQRPEDLSSEGMKAFNEAAAPMAQAAENMKKLNKEINDLNELYIKAEKKNDRGTMRTTKEKLTKLEHELSKTDKAFAEMSDKFAKKFNLSNKEIDAINDSVMENHDAIIKNSGMVERATEGLTSIFRGGTESFMTNTARFAASFGIMAEAFGLAIRQMDELNKKLVQFNRTMSLGFSNEALGMDLYGNSPTGSLETVTGINNISKDEFLNAFKTFSKGQTLGSTQNLKEQQEDMRKFGVQAGQLSKFYGVQMATINSITTSLVYNFGAKVSDLNKILEDGKTAAMQAGVSVSQYFERLKEATDLVGEKYVAGGINGLQNLALYATRTDQSVKSIMASSERMKDFLGQYEQQNKAAALGMYNTSRNFARIWGLNMTGQQDKANMVMNSNLVKDITARGMVDKNNRINQVGMRTLTEMGMSKEEITTLQRLIIAQKEHGLTIEQLNEPYKQNLAIQWKINKFERENLTVSEKLNKIWANVKSIIVDPIVSVLAPVFDTLLNVTSSLVGIIGTILKPVIWTVGMFGKGLSWAGNIISGTFGIIENGFDKLSGMWNTLQDHFDPVTKVLGAVVGGLIALQVASYAAARSMWLSSIGNAISGGGKSFMGKAGSWLSNNRTIGRFMGTRAGGWVSKAGQFLSPKNITKAAGGAWKGIGAGLLVDLAGSALGSKRGGEGGKKISNAFGSAGSIISGAALGAELGTIVPGIGNLVGGVTGAVVGSWDKIENIWTDGSGNLFTNILDSGMAIMQTLGDGAKEIWDWITDNDPEEEEQKKRNRSAALGIFKNTASDVNRIIGQRSVEVAYAAEKAQEQRMTQEFKPNIHITQSFDGSIRARTQGR